MQAHFSIRGPLALTQLESYLDDRAAASNWLASLGVLDVDRGWRDLHDLGQRAGSTSALLGLFQQLVQLLPACPDAGMVLTNLDRFLASASDPGGLLNRFAGDPRSTEIVVQLFSSSQFFSDLLIRDPSLLGWLRSGPARPSLEDLTACLWHGLHDSESEAESRARIRRFRHHEMLRIGYNDIVRDLPLETTAQDLSHLADACVEAAYRLARARAESRLGIPRRSDDLPARLVVIGLGKLGGEELNYSSDIDLLFLYDVEGVTDGPRPVSNAEFFVLVTREMVRLLSDHTELGQAYRVDLRLRPEGDRGPLVRSLPATLAYYEGHGRTWERQALIKARAVAGDRTLGEDFLTAITPFIYRRYLTAAEIGEIRAMKRRIEQRTDSAGQTDTEVKTGRGGLRDVEFVAQFLQLLHGGTYPGVRHPNTLKALERLEEAGCLDAEERGVMDQTYRFLRRVEHRLQVMFDQQTHRLPNSPDELRALAIRMGFAPSHRWEDRNGPTQRFLSTYRYKTDLNRRILNHLLYEAFPGGSETPDHPVVDLVLDPAPTPELVDRALAPYRFRDQAAAYRNLLALAREDIEFLSEARCRHFLAAIAPRMLAEVAQTPDPDMALTNLEKVSASLGAKAVLWELFSVNPPSLHLYVRLCATSQFLSEILINNPGMIDDLIDSLIVDRPQTAPAIRDELDELCHGAEDLTPILTAFRNKEWLRIGARDILNREPIRVVMRELSDVAEAVVGQVATDQFRRLAARYGLPRRGDSRSLCRWAILALGKLGGRELNYHSDLDLVVVYEADGSTRGGSAGTIENVEFFTELVRRMLRQLNGGPGGHGPIYSVDLRLRPYGSSGPLVLSLDAYCTYHERLASTWERLASLRARVIHASGGFRPVMMRAVRRTQTLQTDPATLAAEILSMRHSLERSRNPLDLKRGRGGQVDIEFLVQYLQLVHQAKHPSVQRSNLWEALLTLHREGLLPATAYRDLRSAYDFLRSVESRLRIIQNATGVELVDRPDLLNRVACRLDYGESEGEFRTHAFRADLARHTDRVRSWFLQILESSAKSAPRVRSGQTP